ncbi:MAG: hypothetical protein APG12_00365 [Candidatus Methanofastidiosum methylothiophilum]|uniref:Uncharacterized protein n=1 Tax=Candidatus Methanofastidiosum methylothiophilum TaxID=1705564 RepID=A0A150IU51_9EURY|nr:MAG: hypothetical protein APG10_00209 [Candidatus Methanofastidiosum methylthiophilus]KYC48408.1 MAG: hypothetical protein APG11_00321 [Candidatus Methanofastidiosum methylthiophilus]KYC51080.1 MAG: hypothetical protein APG12_00365 [Candidatus Methanofastidiosum methylthiophilus]
MEKRVISLAVALLLVSATISNFAFILGDRPRCPPCPNPIVFDGFIVANLNTPILININADMINRFDDYGVTECTGSSNYAIDDPNISTGAPFGCGLITCNTNAGTVHRFNNQVIQYTATDPSYCGLKDSFTFTAHKLGQGGCGPDNITIEVRIIINCPNNPVANPDSFTVCSNSCTNLYVLANDSNYGSSPVINVVDQPTGGTATPARDKIYYCAPETPGTYEFNYTVRDGRYTSNKAKVTVTVTYCSPETPPVANPDSFTVCNDFCTNLYVLANDSNYGLSPVINVVDPPTGGTATPAGDKIYYCAPRAPGIYYFDYTVTRDQYTSESARVTVTVSDCGPGIVPEPKEKVIPILLYPLLDLKRLTILEGPITLGSNIGIIGNSDIKKVADENMVSLIDSGTNIVLDGKVIAPLEIAPGTQSLIAQVENRGFVTQTGVMIRFEGLPEEVSYKIEPSSQSIKAHNLGTYTVTITVSPNVPAGTYQIKAVVYSWKGTTDTVELELVVI